MAKRKQENKSNDIMNNYNYKYRMSKECFQSIIATRSGDEKTMNPYDYVIKYINESYGLKGKCVEVAVM